MIFQYVPKADIISKKYGLNLKGENICYEIEFLIYEKNTVLGVKFSAFDRKIISINKCIFESDVLIKYEYAFGGSHLNEVPGISIEIPCYENGCLSSFEWHQFNPPLGLEIRKYELIKDSSGLFSTYKSKQLYGFKPPFDYGDNPPENWTFTVFKSCQGRTHYDISKGWI